MMSRADLISADRRDLDVVEDVIVVPAGIAQLGHDVSTAGVGLGHGAIISIVSVTFSSGNRS
jgi:hypothetical protein